MLVLSAKIRKVFGKKVKNLRKKGLLPAVCYGPGIESLSLMLDQKEFEKIYQKAGKFSLISLNLENKKTYLVLIHRIQKDPLSEKIIHVDFYQPSLEKEVEVMVPLIFEGESPAIKELGGTLIRNISQVKIKALPKNLPSEIKVDIGGLGSFEDKILIKDLKLPAGIKILRNPEEIVATVVPPEKVSEELEKPLVEEVKTGEKKEEKT